MEGKLNPHSLSVGCTDILLSKSAVWEEKRGEKRATYRGEF
jgi:hypothetical protein